MTLRIMVTGGAGFIGSAVARHIIQATRHSVLVIDKLTYAGDLSSLAPASNDLRFDFRQVDICHLAVVKSVIREFAPDIILHLAAESHVDASITSPASFIQTNVIGTYNLLEAALEYWRELPAFRQHQFRFHHISTDEVFGSLGDTGFFTETTPYAPHSPYAASKAASDHFVTAWAHTYGLPVLLTNCSNNFGPFHYPEKLIPRMIVNALREEPLTVHGLGLQTRDWLYVEDHADALLRVATLAEPGSRYVIGGNCERRTINVIDAIRDYIREMCGYLPRITYVPDRPGNDYRYAVDTRKIREELGWKPKHSFEAALRETIEWYIENRDWWEQALKRKELKHVVKGGKPRHPRREVGHA